MRELFPAPESPVTWVFEFKSDNREDDDDVMNEEAVVADAKDPLSEDQEKLEPQNEDDDGDQRDPYATDSGTDYVPPTDESSSSAPSVSSVLEKAFEDDVAVLPMDTSRNSRIVEGNDDPTTSSSKAPAPPVRKEVYKRNRSLCIFCRKTFARLSRHMQSVHKRHPKVALTMTISDKHARARAWRKLRLEGNYEHNCEVLQKAEGELIVQRRTPDYNKDNYLPCTECKGFFKRQCMYKHVQRCKITHKKFDRVQSVSELSLPQDVLAKLRNKPGLKVLVDQVYPKMSSDDVTTVAQQDETIVKWAAYYCGKNIQQTTEFHLTRIVAQKMRDLGRLLMALRKKHGANCSLRGFLDSTR